MKLSKLGVHFGWVTAISIGILSAVQVSGHDAGKHNPHANIVSIGGSITEIIYALGEGHRLVARDTTSNYPAEATHLPNVGYMRRLSPEGVLSVNPELIISEEGSGPPETIAVLEEASVPIITIPDDYSRAGIVAKIKAIGVALDVPEKAEKLMAETDAKLLQAEKKATLTQDKTAKRVLFILSLQGGRVTASGSNTAADAIIQMSGGVNVIDSFEGYKALTDEAVTAAAPDVILMMNRHGTEPGKAADELFAMPAISTTPAAKAKALVQMDGLLLLGFGPRTSDAILELNSRLYGG